MQLICSHGPVLTMWQEWRMANSFVWLSVSLASFQGHAQLSVACTQYTVFSGSGVKNSSGNETRVYIVIDACLLLLHELFYITSIYGT